jgi:hypothetical protein
MHRQCSASSRRCPSATLRLVPPDRTARARRRRPRGRRFVCDRAPVHLPPGLGAERPVEVEPQGPEPSSLLAVVPRLPVHRPPLASRPVEARPGEVRLLVEEARPGEARPVAGAESAGAARVAAPRDPWPATPTVSPPPPAARRASGAPCPGARLSAPAHAGSASSRPGRQDCGSRTVGRATRPRVPVGSTATAHPPRPRAAAARHHRQHRTARSVRWRSGSWGRCGCRSSRLGLEA